MKNYDLCRTNIEKRSLWVKHYLVNLQWNMEIEIRVHLLVIVNHLQPKCFSNVHLIFGTKSQNCLLLYAYPILMHYKP